MKTLQPCTLLYPVDQKNYQSDPFISDEWNRVQNALDMAFTLTMFGYGTPETNQEAVELMRSAWNGKRVRQLEMVELIDVKETRILEEQWKAFLFSHHYRHIKSLRIHGSENIQGAHMRLYFRIR